MLFTKWIPWQYFARKAAQAYGFADPTDTLTRIRRFSKPSESNEPIELLRAGFAFHARGLANTKAIQNNLDWVWPYWIRRQYDPRDPSFVPRAFSFSHINLTQRNWTAVGVPGSDHYSIVDPRGLVTPFHDSWSLDFWIINHDGSRLYPSHGDTVQQSLETNDDLAVRTRSEGAKAKLETIVSMKRHENGSLHLHIELTALASQAANLVIAIRPYNPEGIQFIDTIKAFPEKSIIEVNDEHIIHLPENANSIILSDYSMGDVAHIIDQAKHGDTAIHCPVGMATSAALVQLQPSHSYHGSLRVPIDEHHHSATRIDPSPWSEFLKDTTRVLIPDTKVTKQYDISLRTLALLSPDDIYPGPYTYKRFWFRDACLIAHALLKTGQSTACRTALEKFPPRQTKTGYFLSQEGEWDSNGQVLWIYNLYEKISGELLPPSCFDSIQPAINWIRKKLIKAPGKAHHGLLPAGFSAEHFGPNDHYYWDDFWAIGGLRAASELFERRKAKDQASNAAQQANQLLQSVEESLANLTSTRAKGKLPASPYRRMDSGAIGSLVSDYPLHIWEPGNPSIIDTADFLKEHCLVEGAFFQDMIHSGLNIYLTLALAQTYLRAGDPSWENLSNACLELATDTGQWPEAIHPQTKGGCMGDGQHAWAAAEWTLFVANRFIREEGSSLVIGSGVTNNWLQNSDKIGIYRLPTSFGIATLEIDCSNLESLGISLSFSHPRQKPKSISYQIPGYHKSEGENLYQTTLQHEQPNL